MEEVPAPTPFIKKHAALFAGISLFASWVLFFHYWWPLGGLVVLVAGIILGFHSSKASLAQLLLSPFVVVPLFSFGLGVLGYLTGQGCLRTRGERFMEDANLDPTYRCVRTSSGCVVNGSEFLQDNPNNIAIEILTTIFGPMRGAYRGPYPTREEAIQAVNRSKLQFLPGEFSRYAEGLRLPSLEAINAIERQLKGALDKDLPISVTIHQDETIILGREKCVFLIERRTGKIYARYYFHYSARALLANGETDKAIAGLDHAIEVDPRNPHYLQERGDAYLRKGDPARASVDYRKALEIAPVDWYYRTEVEGKLAWTKAGSS